MFEVLSSLLSDKKGSVIFNCFGIYHIIYILIFFFIAISVCVYLKSKSNEIRNKIISRFINIAFSVYILDFFLMPFAYGEIDIEKLPFHICTATCVLCFISRHNLFLKKYKLQFAMLGFISNLVYLIYPAGVMWYQVSIYSYRVIQTLSFHGIMMVYGLIVVVFEREEFSFKKCYRDLFVIISVTLWAIIGNALYNSEQRVYNWFFVVRDPFYLLSENMAPYIMPFINITLFFIVELIAYTAFSKILNQKTREKLN